MLNKYKWKYKSTDLMYIDNYTYIMKNKTKQDYKYYVRYTSLSGSQEEIELLSNAHLEDAIVTFKKGHKYAVSNFSSVDIVVRFNYGKDCVLVGHINEDMEFGLSKSLLRKCKKGTIDMKF